MSLMIECIVLSLSNEESNVVAKFIWIKESSLTTWNVQNRLHFEEWYYATKTWNFSCLSTKEIGKIECPGNCYFNAVFERIEIKYRTVSCSLLFSSASSIS